MRFARQINSVSHALKFDFLPLFFLPRPFQLGGFFLVLNVLEFASF